MPEESSREFDIVLWGATGFAGRLVAEYLAEYYADGSLTWAIAGRNEAKLEALRGELTAFDAGLAELPILVGDSFDRDSLDAIAARTRVVCTTVGPYAKYGNELVAACVAQGADYCDLTGEVHWIRRMIDAHHDQARENGARIVNCCGFDSIPSDLGTLMVQDFAQRRFDAPCSQVKFYLAGASGGFSGGTIDSMANALEEATKDSQARRAMGHPYALNPDGEQHGPDGSSQGGPRYDEDIGGWTGPFVMARINEKIVRRSNAVLDYRYGRDFSYSETTRTGSGPKGAVAAGALSAGMGAFAGAMMLEPTRKLLQKFVLPAPGEGPSREDIEGGYFKVQLLGKGTTPDGESFRVRGQVAADRDPGYGATAKMLAESAICLANDEADGLDGGVLTPASAMGMPLVERLREAGMTFDVEEER